MKTTNYLPFAWLGKHNTQPEMGTQQLPLTYFTASAGKPKWSCTRFITEFNHSLNVTIIILVNIY